MAKQANILGQNPFGQYKGLYSPRALFPDIRGITRSSIWEWALGSFTNASDRYITQGSSMTGPFTANVLATRMIGGHRYAQIEKERTESLTYNEQFENVAIWPCNDSTITGNNLIAPNGTLNMDSFVENTANNNHFILRSGLSIAPGFISLFVKKIGSAANRNVRIQTNAKESDFFNLTTGVWGSHSVNHSRHYASLLSDGTWHIGFYNASITQYFVLAIADNETNVYTGDGVSGIGLWGGSVKTGKYITSYMTAGSGTVTRAKDVLIMPNAVVPSFLKSSTTPFTTNLVFNNYDSLDLTADTGKKYLFSVDGTSDIECYLNGADNKIYIDQGGVNKFTSTAKTWAIGANPKVSFIPDNGSSECRVITTGFATGDGTETGTAFAQQSDGIWSIGSKFGTDDQQLDGMIAEFRQGTV